MPATIAPGSVQTELNYANPVPGNVWETDFTKPDAEAHFEKFERNKSLHPTTVVNVRSPRDDFSLSENGFQYVDHEVPALKDADSEDKIAEILLPATEELVKRVSVSHDSETKGDLLKAEGRTGATKTIVFTHRIRSKSEDDSKRADSKAPALSVHSDFTPAGAERHLLNVIRDASEREQLQKGRIMIINVWRPLKTIRRDPLAVCDWKSVDYKQDWTANRMILPHGWHELGAVKHSPQHQWYHLQQQTPSEPLVFVQYDSRHAGKGGMCVAHSAFVDPAFADAEPRESMEIKMFAFVPESVA